MKSVADIVNQHSQARNIGGHAVSPCAPGGHSSCGPGGGGRPKIQRHTRDGTGSSRHGHTTNSPKPAMSFMQQFAATTNAEVENHDPASNHGGLTHHIAARGRGGIPILPPGMCGSRAGRGAQSDRHASYGLDLAALHSSMQTQNANATMTSRSAGAVCASAHHEYVPSVTGCESEDSITPSPRSEISRESSQESTTSGQSSVCSQASSFNRLPIPEPRHHHSRKSSGRSTASTKSRSFDGLAHKRSSSDSMASSRSFLNGRFFAKNNVTRSTSHDIETGISSSESECSPVSQYQYSHKMPKSGPAPRYPKRGRSDNKKKKSSWFQKKVCCCCRRNSKSIKNDHFVKNAGFMVTDYGATVLPQ